jgi:hypothetical protein
MGCNFRYAQQLTKALHQKFALTFMIPVLRLLASTVERVGELKTCRSEVDWVISQAGQPAGRPDLKKPTALRGVVGVWDCESSDRIKGL